jgi:hypothetical protein
MNYKEMPLAQEKSYMQMRAAGYEFCHNETNGDVVVGKYSYTDDSTSLLYQFAIKPDGKCIDLTMRYTRLSAP